MKQQQQFIILVCTGGVNMAIDHLPLSLPLLPSFSFPRLLHVLETQPETLIYSDIAH